MIIQSTQFTQEATTQEDSAARRFLARVASAYQRRECVRDVDLRDSRQSCRRYRFRGRVLWLDDESLVIFQDGLKQHAGFFTIGTYLKICGDDEALCGASHAWKSLLKAHKRLLRDANETIELGYFEKRREIRIKFITRVLLITPARIISARTRDISKSGMQVRTTGGCELSRGDLVEVKLQDVVKPSRDQIRYRVVSVEQAGNHTRISLQCDEDQINPVAELMSESVSKFNGDSSSYCVDTTDASLTAYALLVERLYSRSTTLIPFLLTQDQNDAYGIDFVWSNQNNQEALAVFEYAPNRYDFSGLVTARMLGYLSRLVAIDGQASLLIAVRRVGATGQVKVLAHSECKRERTWYAYLARYRQQDGFRAFQIVARRVRKAGRKRLMEGLRPLVLVSPGEATRLIGDLARVVAQCGLVDITGEVRDWNLSPYLFAEGGRGRRDGEVRLSNPPQGPKPWQPRILSIAHLDQINEDIHSTMIDNEMLFDQVNHPSDEYAASNVDAIAARLLSAFIAENALALPMVFFGADDRTPHVKIGLTERRSPIARFFETEPASFDFSALTSARRVKTLFHEANEYGRSEMILYLVKERIGREMRFTIWSIADRELLNHEQRQELLDSIVACDFRIFKVVVTRVQPLPEHEIDRALDRLDSYSPRRADALRDEFANVLAVGEVMDATGRFREFKHFYKQRRAIKRLDAGDAPVAVQT